MSKVEFEDGAISIDATVVAEGFGLSTDQIRHLMRTLKMTTRCERGIDADAGRHRLTFLYGMRHLRLLVDETGAIIERSLIDTGDTGESG
ncbi:MAG TPA: DUF6522 family protein [Steroidobacteraceae bacterium]|nr:DUF6522 family protein [Steroidobacteraceae bacterium]